MRRNYFNKRTLFFLIFSSIFLFTISCYDDTGRKTLIPPVNTSSNIDNENVGAEDISLKLMDNDNAYEKKNEYRLASVSPTQYNLTYYNPFDTISANQVVLYQESNGGYNGFKLWPMTYGTGFHVYGNGRSWGNSEEVKLYPTQQPLVQYILLKGTISFQARVEGGYRGKGDDTYINSYLYFNLTSSLCVFMRNLGGKDNTDIFIALNDPNVGYVTYKVYTIHKSIENNVILQWDFSNYDPLTTNLALYINHVLVFERKNMGYAYVSAYAGFLKNSTYYFRHLIETSNAGDYRPDTTASDVDEIKIYNDIINPYML